MKYIQGQNRTQTYLFPVTLDDAISEDNEVRLIDVFVNSLALKSYGFQIEHIENGRPAYHPGDLLKLFVSVRLTHLSRNHPMNYVCYNQIKENHEKQTKDVSIGKAMV